MIVRSSATSECPRSMSARAHSLLPTPGVAAQHHADALNVERRRVLDPARANSLSMQRVAR